MTTTSATTGAALRLGGDLSNLLDAAAADGDELVLEAIAGLLEPLKTLNVALAGLPLDVAVDESGNVGSVANMRAMLARTRLGDNEHIRVY